MRVLIALTVTSLIVAIVASVFAIWPVVADAPWEDDRGTPSDQRAADEEPGGGSDGISLLRCEQALALQRETLDDFRDAVVTGVNNPDAANQYYRSALEKIQRDIDRYC